MPARRGWMPLRRGLRASDTQFPGGTRIWTKFGLGIANLVQNLTCWVKFGYFNPKLEILVRKHYLVHIRTFGPYSDIWSELRYLIHIRTFGPTSGARRAKGPDPDAVGGAVVAGMGTAGAAGATSRDQSSSSAEESCPGAG